MYTQAFPAEETDVTRLLRAIEAANREDADLLLIDALGPFLDDMITIYETQEGGRIVTDEK
jgi:hypothetical protein